MNDKKSPVKRLLALVLLQAGTMLAWAGHSDYVLAHAPTFRVPLQPVDPYDPLRGRYFRLGYADGRIVPGQPPARLTAEAAAPLLHDAAFAGDALVGFCPDGATYRACALQPLGAPTGTGAAYWVRARVEYYRAAKGGGAPLMLDFAPDRFFIPNRARLPGRERDPGWELEVAYRPGQRLVPRRLWFRGQPVVFD